MVADGELATGRNPRHPDFAPGGSSSGTAAATAAGLCVVGLGADGGGSVRNPAAACGVVGFKPTEHRLPKDGCHPWTITMLSAGTFARDVEGAARGFDVIAGTTSELTRERPPRLAMVGAGDLGGLDPRVANAMGEAADAFRAAGASLLDAPSIDLSVGDAWLARMREFAHAHALPLLTSGESYSEGMRQLIAHCDGVSVESYLDSFAVADRLRSQVDAALVEVDALLLPANPWPAVRWEDWAKPETFNWYRFSWPFNLSWHPGIAVPWSLGDDGFAALVPADRQTWRRRESARCGRVVRAAHDVRYGAGPGLALVRHRRRLAWRHRRRLERTIDRRAGRSHDRRPAGAGT